MYIAETVKFQLSRHTILVIEPGDILRAAFPYEKLKGQSIDVVFYPENYELPDNVRACIDGATSKNVQYMPYELEIVSKCKRARVRRTIFERIRKFFENK